MKALLVLLDVDDVSIKPDSVSVLLLWGLTPYLPSNSALYTILEKVKPFFWHIFSTQELFPCSELYEKTLFCFLAFISFILKMWKSESEQGWRSQTAIVAETLEQKWRNKAALMALTRAHSFIYSWLAAISGLLSACGGSYLSHRLLGGSSTWLTAAEAGNRSAEGEEGGTKSSESGVITASLLVRFSELHHCWK